MSSECYFKSCTFLESEGWFTLETRYIHSHALLQRYGAPPLLEEGATHKEADADLNMRKAVHYALEHLTPKLRLLLFPVVYLAMQVQAPSAITELYSTHFPYLEFQDCDGDHSKVIEKYVELYLKVPFVIAFIEKEMVKRGMDVNVGVHVFNSMWSKKERKKAHTAHRAL